MPRNLLELGKGRPGAPEGAGRGRAGASLGWARTRGGGEHPGVGEDTGGTMPRSALGWMRTWAGPGLPQPRRGQQGRSTQFWEKALKSGCRRAEQGRGGQQSHPPCPQHRPQQPPPAVSPRATGRSEPTPPPQELWVPAAPHGRPGVMSRCRERARCRWWHRAGDSTCHRTGPRGGGPGLAPGVALAISRWR